MVAEGTKVSWSQGLGVTGSHRNNCRRAGWGLSPVAVLLITQTKPNKLDTLKHLRDSSQVTLFYKNLRNRLSQNLQSLLRMKSAFGAGSRALFPGPLSERGPS